MKLRIIRIATADNIEFVFEFFVPGDALPDGVEIEIAPALESLVYADSSEGLPV